MPPAVKPPPSRPSRGRRARRPTGDEREQAILATFEQLVAERPLHEISIDEIARGAGISRPTFYFYFASKEAVLLSLFERMLAEGQATRGDSLERLAEDPPARLREALTAFYDVFRTHRAVTLAGAAAQASSAEVQAVWARAMETWVGEATAAIEAERARGAAPAGVDARELATALLLMNERVQLAALAGHTPAVHEDAVIDVLVAVWSAAIYGAAALPAG